MISLIHIRQISKRRVAGMPLRYRGLPRRIARLKKRSDFFGESCVIALSHLQIGSPMKAEFVKVVGGFNAGDLPAPFDGFHGRSILADDADHDADHDNSIDKLR